MNRLGGVLVGTFVDCHCGGGDDAGLLLRSDSGVVARSSSGFSRSASQIEFYHYKTIIPIHSLRILLFLLFLLFLLAF